MARHNWPVTERLPERTSRFAIERAALDLFWRLWTRKFCSNSPLRRSNLQCRQRLSPAPLCRSGNTSGRSITAERWRQEVHGVICCPFWCYRSFTLAFYMSPKCKTNSVDQAPLEVTWQWGGLSCDTGSRRFKGKGLLQMKAVWLSQMTYGTS